MFDVDPTPGLAGEFVLPEPEVFTAYGQPRVTGGSRFDVCENVRARYRDVVDAQIALLDAVAEFDRRSAHIVDGARSGTAWFCSAFGVGFGEGKRILSDARGFALNPLVREAVVFEELDLAKATVMVEHFIPARAVYVERDTDTLIEMVQRLDARDVRRS